MSKGWYRHHRGNHSIYCFPDGEPISSISIATAGQLIVHDNADTIAHLMGMGWELGDRNKWKSLRMLSLHLAITLAESGVIVGRSSKALETTFFSCLRYVATMLAVVNMDTRKAGIWVFLTSKSRPSLKEVAKNSTYARLNATIGHFET